MNLKDKAVLITGGSRGLGAALALELAGRGARLALVARAADALAATAAAVRAKGGTAFPIAADVGSRDGIHTVAASATALLGDLDAVVHNASTLGAVPLRLLADTECADVQRVLDVNLIGPFRLTKALLGPMLFRGSGLIVHVSSDAAVEAYPNWGVYGISKAALDHLGRSWAVELADTGVRFLSVDPGEMDTAMHAAAVPGAERSQLRRPADVAVALADLIADGNFETGARIELGHHEVPG